MSFLALYNFIKTHKESKFFNHIQHESGTCENRENAHLFVSAINQKIKECGKKLPKEESIVEEFPFTGAYSHLVKKGSGLSRKMDRKNYLKI